MNGPRLLIAGRLAAFSAAGALVLAVGVGCSGESAEPAQEVAALSDELEELRSQVSDLSDELEVVRSQVEELAPELDTLRADLDALAEEVGGTTLEDSVNEIRSKLESICDELSFSSSEALQQVYFAAC